TLRTNNWNVCGAVDELILAHRETDMPTEKKGDGVRITRLDTTAQAGGFVALEQHKGSLEVRHSSALPPQRAGVGEKRFRQRVMMFEKEKDNQSGSV
ncbi:putative C2 domain protein, partial [Toxoplasma gondii ARI]